MSDSRLTSSRGIRGASMFMRLVTFRFIYKMVDFDPATEKQKVSCYRDSRQIVCWQSAAVRMRVGFSGRTTSNQQSQSPKQPCQNYTPTHKYIYIYIIHTYLLFKGQFAQLHEFNCVEPDRSEQSSARMKTCLTLRVSRCFKCLIFRLNYVFLINLKL